MKTSFVCPKGISDSIDENIRVPLGETAVLVQEIREGSIPPEHLEKHYKNILQNIVAIDTYFSIILYPNKRLFVLPKLKEFLEERH